jgi:hypothetical protein
MGEINLKYGKRRTLVPAGYRSLIYWPDEPLCRVSEHPFRLLAVSGRSTVLMQGATYKTAASAGEVLRPGSAGAFDNGYAGIGSCYRTKKTRKLLALYHAEDHEEMPIRKGNQTGYWSIGLAESDNIRISFTKKGCILRSSTDKTPALGHHGIGDVSVVVDRTQSVLYAYYTDLTRRQGDARARIGMARCRVQDDMGPGQWFKWDGEDFRATGISGQETGVLIPPTGVRQEFIQPHVSYLTAWGKYLMACCVVDFDDEEAEQAKTGGIAYCWSDDGIHWNMPKVFIVALPNPYEGREYAAHPFFFLPRVTSDTARGWLFYCYSDSFGLTKPHRLARRVVTLRKPRITQL